MSTHSTPWAAGTPCWVDMAADDQAATRTFYSGLLGWEFDVQPPEYGGYGMAKVKGRAVAGVGGKQDTSQPSAWTTYLASNDVDATTAKVTEAGGAVVVPPMDVGTMGRMAICADSAGAAFGVWQASQMIGAELVNEPGGLIWNDQASSDLDGSAAFYGTVFGLTTQPIPETDMPYRTLHEGDQIVGGVGALESDEPAHWQSCFAVLDTDAVAARATELGGRVVSPPADTPYGRLATIAGLEGETFSVMSTSPEGEQHRPSD
ncbi:MAG: VOC family protein [Angustibacter sp.]